MTPRSANRPWVMRCVLRRVSDTIAGQSHTMSCMATRTCRGTRADGAACHSPIVRRNGYCPLHGPGAKASELGRRGGVRSGLVRRARSRSPLRRLDGIAQRPTTSATASTRRSETGSRRAASMAGPTTGCACSPRFSSWPVPTYRYSRPSLNGGARRQPRRIEASRGTKS